MRLKRKAIPAFVALAVTQIGLILDTEAAETPFPEYTRQWGLGAINVLGAWDTGASGAGVTVAVLDSGVRAGHADLAGHVLLGYNVINGSSNTNDDNGHGTAVTGIIAASRNGIGTVGVAYNANILPVKVSLSDNTHSPESITAGVNYTLNTPARVLNLSLQGESSNELTDTLYRAAQADKVIVIAAGNQGYGGLGPISRNVIYLGGKGLAVGAVDPNRNIYSWSNRAGSAMNDYVVAPGEDIYTTSAGGSFEYFGGTSAAAPHVSGIAALLFSLFPHLSAAQVVDIIKKSSTDLGAPGVDEVYGWGLVNASAALSPSGTVSVPTDGGGGGGAGVALGALVLGGALAYGLKNKEKPLETTLVLDEYNRAYVADLNSMIRARSQIPDLKSLLDQMELEQGTRELMLAPGHSLRFSYATPVSQSAVERPLLRDSRFEDPFGVSADTVKGWAAALGGRIGMEFGYALGMHTDPRRNFGTLAGDLSADLSSAFLTNRTFTAPFLGFQDTATSATFSYAPRQDFELKFGLIRMKPDEEDGSLEADSQAAVVEGTFHPSSASALSLQFGRLAENGSLFGGAGDGPFSVQTSDTVALSLMGRITLSDGVTLFGGYGHGLTKVADKANSLLHDVSNLYSETYGIGLSIDSMLCAGDRFGFTLSRPLRVVHGSARLDIPVDYDYATARASFVHDTLSLVPDGRETDFETFYRRRLGANGEFGAHLLVRDQPDHDASAERDHRIYLTYALRY